MRLVNGSTSNEGRAEHCYNGEWVPFCGMSSMTASLICKQLGYSYTCEYKVKARCVDFDNYTDGSVFNDQRFGRNNKRSLFSHKFCNGSHQSLSQCIDVIKASSCYITLSQCSIEYSLRCYSKIPP